ncbi:hypothetical protein CLV33_101383 [Jejuia pallidilutea]|uniref:Uncharacterized protein n=1 Tax=Jejuia pallidilutea TaxID=504487 RepID=A0A362XDY5_9FLAO|nr:hypothetical protein CLV33_101383 [Jejuia pallidilutea]
MLLLWLYFNRLLNFWDYEGVRDYNNEEFEGIA